VREVALLEPSYRFAVALDAVRPNQETGLCEASQASSSSSIRDSRVSALDSSRRGIANLLALKMIYELINDFYTLRHK
jgi:hypothetical protein